MRRKKFFVFNIIAVLTFACLFKHAYSQGEIAPVESQEVSLKPLLEEDIQYVKPGHVTVNFKDADIMAVLNYFSEVSHVDIVPAPDVAGQITMKLTDKPWETALDILVRNYGYVLVREGNIIRVLRKDALEGEEPITEVIYLDYLVPIRKLGKVEKEGLVAEGALTEEELTGIQLLQTAIQAILKKGESVTFLPSANAFVVTAIPARINRIREMIGKIDIAPPQIMLEAKIIEVLLGKDEKMGIDWNVIVGVMGAKRPTTFPFANWANRDILPHALGRFFPFGQTSAVTAQATAGGGTTSTTPSEFPQETTFDGTQTSSFPFVETSAFTFGTLDFTQFSAVLRLLKTNYDTSILASPRITTMNNQEAYIKVARQLFLEQVESTSETGGTVGTRFESTAREIGVFLQVIPHINENGQISVTLKPRADGEPQFRNITVQSGDDRVVLEYTTRMAETQVMVADGETIFIGGLINETMEQKENKLPLLGDVLGDVPFLGPLFKYKSDVLRKTEIVIFVTVYIVKDRKQLNRLGIEGFSPSEHLIDHMEEEMEGLLVEEDEEEGEEGYMPLFDFRKYKE